MARVNLSGILEPTAGTEKWSEVVILTPLGGVVSEENECQQKIRAPKSPYTNYSYCALRMLEDLNPHLTWLVKGL